jgi:hypothetical protein
MVKARENERLCRSEIIIVRRVHGRADDDHLMRDLLKKA